MKVLIVADPERAGTLFDQEGGDMVVIDYRRLRDYEAVKGLEQIGLLVIPEDLDEGSKNSIVIPFRARSRATGQTSKVLVYSDPQLVSSLIAEELETDRPRRFRHANPAMETGYDGRFA